MYNNKQDFVPPLVPGPDQYIRFQYFLNKAYGQLGYHSAN